MTFAAYIPTGPLALLVSLALLGLGCLITCGVVVIALALIGRRDRRRRERRDLARPGYLPERVARSYREPSRPLPPVHLVAIAPGGSVIVVREQDTTWLYPPEGAARPSVIDPARAEQIIARQGLDRVGRDFADWGELEAFRQQHARRRLTDTDLERWPVLPREPR